LADLTIFSRGVERAAGQEAAREGAAFDEWGAVDDGRDRFGGVVVRDVCAPGAARAHGHETVAAADYSRPTLVARVAAGARRARAPRLRLERLARFGVC
jgi:hypothetical protein